MQACEKMTDGTRDAIPRTGHDKSLTIEALKSEYFCAIIYYMKKIISTLLLLIVGITIAMAQAVSNDTVHFEGEKHFRNVQQLTFGGDNAEAYWSYDGKYILFQKTSVKEGIPCDQIYMGKVPTKPGENLCPNW